ncbi:MAG: SUMF1/EgtB/PvdO family nonheme iron enzyme [bacterium]
MNTPAFPKALSKIRLFIASPSDLLEERARLLRVVHEFNRPNGLLEQLGLSLQALDWRTHVAPHLGRPEESVLKQLPVESWDMFVGMMWLRFGTPTGGIDPQSGLAFDSGTQEEFTLAYRAWQKNNRPRVLLYRCTRAPRNVLEIDPTQLQGVNKFFAQFKPDGEHPGFCPTFEQAEDFERRVRGDLEIILLALAKEHGHDQKISQIAARPFEQDDEARLYLERIIAAYQCLPVAGFETNLRIPIQLDKVYVTLMARMTELEHAKVKSQTTAPSAMGVSQAVTVQEALQFAISRKYDVLVILGSPGAGKTTLAKFFLLCFATSAESKLGWPSRLLPFLLLLREINPAQPLLANILTSLQKIGATLPEETILSALNAGQAILLLDGLDEVPTEEQRAVISRWIHQKVHVAFPRCPVVVTSRFSGYRGEAVLPGAYLRLEIQDFDRVQIRQFLENWLTAVETHLHEDNEYWRNLARRHAEDLFNRIVSTPTLLELATNPLMLQIIALVHRDRGALPERRVELYKECTDVLLERWDKAKGLEVPLTAAQARQLLQPLALWMHSVENRREVKKADVLTFLQPVLPRIKREANVEDLLASWRERSGIFKGEGDTFFFQHLSFQEYLTAEEIRNSRQVEILVENFDHAWWREPTLLAVSLTNPPIFAEFVQRLLRARREHGMSTDFLLRCLDEALVKSEEPFITALKRLRRFEPRHLAMLALERIGTEAAKAALRSVLQDQDDRLAILAQNLLARLGETPVASQVEEVQIQVRGKLRTVPARLFNPGELNAEYVLIPGGKYKFSVTSQKIDIPPLYFAKYPVTNKLYHRFLDYLAGSELEESQKSLPLEQYAETLLAMAKNIKGMSEYLDKNFKQWTQTLRTQWHDDKRFNMEDQPVVGVSWYAATAYCHWLTEMQKANGREKEEKIVFRLPTEAEWEWAASGGKREYPWGDEEPNATRANYGQNVGYTTPVGAYPAGATPEGLMDMAGNVWEWMENPYKKDENARALRGGSWNDDAVNLRCAARNNLPPGNYWNDYGFRVVRAQSFFDSLRI